MNINIHLKNKILTTPAFDVYEIYESRVKDHSNAQEITQPELVVEANNKTNLTDKIWDNF